MAFRRRRKQCASYRARTGTGHTPVSANNDTARALAAPRRAVRGRHFVPAGLLHHTDRGSPADASDDYREELTKYAMIASMSRKGDCWDNAPSKSFFAMLRAELVYDERYLAVSAAEISIGDNIEKFYSVERTLDYVSPLEFELKAQVVKIAA